MAEKRSACCGCLLGMAAGDALGYTIDDKSWQEIMEDYGPYGLMGYDVVNGTVQVSSYTQVGAYMANGLLLGVTRGRPELFPKYMQIALREWGRRQNVSFDTDRFYCWVSQIPSLRARHCRDGRMADALRMTNLGSVDAPRNSNSDPGSMTGAAMVGLAYDAARMDKAWITQTGAEAVAATHGAEEAFLSGAVLANIIAGILQAPQKPLKEQFMLAIEAMDAFYRERFSGASQLAVQLKRALSVSYDHRQAMEQLHCSSAAQCLAGAMYACLASGGDFDTAMITAVNHSGKSAAVGAVAGAIMGAWLGEENLPDFYLEGLEVAPVLRELAQDLAEGSPTMGLFNDAWDQKYAQGRPPGSLN